MTTSSRAAQRILRKEDIAAKLGHQKVTMQTH